MGDALLDPWQLPFRIFSPPFFFLNFRILIESSDEGGG
jgi:hypothetical protein